MANASRETVALTDAFDSKDSGGAAQSGHAYSVFILVLTVISLAVMVLLVLPVSESTVALLLFYDNAICFIFLVDFAINLRRAPSKRGYFFGGRGWLDLLGSIPSLGFFRFTALLRLARLSRFARLARLFRGSNRQALVRDIVQHRAQYAGFVTVLIAFVVLITASVVVLNAESQADEGNITTGWDAFWWSFVTITTVGYGDHFPVTVVGRIGAMFVMTMGIGIIGALASILASMLTGDSGGSDGDAAASGTIGADLEAIKAELVALRESIERLSRDSGAP